MKVDILAVGSHPDDIELGCAGTLISHRAKGYSVGLLDLTLGELGTRGNAKTRTREAQEAATTLGATFRRQLNLRDGFFQEDTPSLMAVIQEIRNCQPKILLANAVKDRHPDHGRGARLVARAAFLSGLRRIETVDEHGMPQQPWRPGTVYHYIQDQWIDPDFVVDITPYFEQKIALVLHFGSQFYDPKSQDPDTPISGKDFLEFLEARARDMGRPSGYTYGEGFITTRYPGIQDLFVLE